MNLDSVAEKVQLNSSEAVARLWHPSIFRGRVDFLARLSLRLMFGLVAIFAVATSLAVYLYNLYINRTYQTTFVLIALCTIGIPVVPISIGLTAERIVKNSPRIGSRVFVLTSIVVGLVIAFLLGLVARHLIFEIAD